MLYYLLCCGGGEGEPEDVVGDSMLLVGVGPLELANEADVKQEKIHCQPALLI